jgi:hypothetical protein
MAINVLGILDGITKSPTSHRDLGVFIIDVLDL